MLNVKCITKHSFKDVYVYTVALLYYNTVPAQVYYNTVPAQLVLMWCFSNCYFTSLF